jgi:hypothetical protein
MQAICATQVLQTNYPQLAIGQIVAVQTASSRSSSILHLPYVLHDLFQVIRLLEKPDAIWDSELVRPRKTRNNYDVNFWPISKSRIA